MRREQAKLDSLARDSSADGRGRLLMDLSRLVLTNSSVGESELTAFFDIVRTILPDAASDYRRLFSETAADRDGIPRDVLRILASDDAGIAEPVLTRSRGFTEPDLIEFASTWSDDHRLAIAARAVVSGNVTEILVRLGSRAVLHRLGSNDGAVFTATAVQEIGRRAEGDEALFRVLVARADLAERLADTLRTALTRMAEPAPVAERRRKAPPPEPVRPPAPVRPENRGVARMLDDLKAGRRTLDDIVAELADGDRHADLARFLGEVAAIDDTQILRVLVRADANGIATVARGMEMAPETYDRIVELRRRKLKFTTTQARWEREHFVRLDVEEARVTLSAFTDRRKPG